MVNCNPETVSTDYDTSRPPLLRAPHPRGPGHVHRAASGVGGGRPGGRGHRQPRGTDPAEAGGQLPEELVLGTSPGLDRSRRGPRAVERAVRAAWRSPSPRGDGHHAAEALGGGRRRIGYPVLVRPSYVLGGRAMEIVYDDERLAAAVEAMASRSGSLGREGGLTADPAGADRPVPGGRHRGRRRRRARRHRRGRHRRGDGARGRGRRALRRLGLRDPPPDPVGPGDRRLERYTRGHRRRPRRPRPRSTCSTR